LLLRNSFVVLAITAGCSGLAAVAVSCSSSSSGPPPATAAPIPKSSCVDAGLTIAFNPMYSAFDGTHLFQIPAVVRGSNGSVTWSADERMVGMQADMERPNEVLIQMLKPGNVLINVESSDGKCGSAVLFISPAAESDWEIGNARYNDGHSLHLAAGATGGTGSPLEMGSMGGPACTSCHGETATNGPYTNVSHTPEQTGGFSDEDLLNIILRGDFPDGGFFDTKVANRAAWHNFHRWTDITSDQQKGIITYLRSLTPVYQKGSINIGAFDDLDAGGSDNQGGDSTVVMDTGTGADVASMEASVDAGTEASVDAGTEASNTPPPDAGDGATE
jgi:hypothetical protein